MNRHRRHGAPATSALAFWAALNAGCATTAAPDPIEPFNRKMFAFNERVDEAILRPAAVQYSRIVPSPVKESVTHFFDNAEDLWSAANLLMQGQVRTGALEVLRFGMNTTVGVLGFFDVATGQGLPRHRQTFGRTLGAWGVESGAYLVLPIWGPTTVRDGAGLPLDFAANPLSWIANVPASIGVTSTSIVNERSNALPSTDLVDAAALDKYLFVRDAYFQRRNSRSIDQKSEPGTEPDLPPAPTAGSAAEDRRVPAPDPKALANGK